MKLLHGGLCSCWPGLQGGYNLCHFWSNFELGDLRFFRSRPYLDFFDWLDRCAPASTAGPAATLNGTWSSFCC